MPEKNNDGLKFSNVVFSTEKQEREDKFRVPKKIINYTIYSAIIIVAVYAVFFSKFFIIKSVEVENVKSVEIEDYANRTLLGKNILFMLPGRYLKELTNEFPVLQEARIVRGLPNTVKVIVDERDQKFIWCNSKSCFEVDNNGYIFEQTAPTAGGVVLRDLSDIQVKPLDQVVSKEFISFFISALEGLKGLNLEITEAQIKETTFKVDFVTKEGWKIIMDSSSSVKNQIYAVKQVLENNRADIKEYIDVRVEGAVFIK